MQIEADAEISTHDQALEILQHTQDGNSLSMEDLALLETVVNSGLAALTEQGRAHWQNLHSRTVAGTYKLPWLHGHQNLTKDQEGYVHWKGVLIEHYSFSDRAKEAVAARELARVCATVEARGLPMTWSSCSQIYEEARFGQGIESPRMHVFWIFSEDRHDLVVFPESSRDMREAAANGQKHAQQLAHEWSCPDGALRRALILSQESLTNCERCIRGDSAWARAVLRSSVEQCKSVEHKLQQQIALTIGTQVLPTQKALSEQIVVRPIDEPCESGEDSPTV